jgi:hypothetical protein
LRRDSDGVCSVISWIGQSGRRFRNGVSGEAELETMRMSDGWVVNKHYDLETTEDPGRASDDLGQLVAHESVPANAVTTWAKPRD